MRKTDNARFPRFITIILLLKDAGNVQSADPKRHFFGDGFFYAATDKKYIVCLKDIGVALRIHYLSYM